MDSEEDEKDKCGGSTMRHKGDEYQRSKSETIDARGDTPEHLFDEVPLEGEAPPECRREMKWLVNNRREPLYPIVPLLVKHAPPLPSLITMSITMPLSCDS